MSFKVEAVPYFEKEAKKLIKKYKSLKAELKTLIEQLENNPTKVLILAMASTKFVLLLLPKARVSLGEPG